MAEKVYSVSERDYRRLQTMLRWYESVGKNLTQQLRRRGGISDSGGGVTFFKLYETDAEPMSGYEVVFNSTTKEWDFTNPETLVSNIYRWPTLQDVSGYGFSHYAVYNVIGCVKSGGAWIALYSVPLPFIPYT